MHERMHAAGASAAESAIDDQAVTSLVQHCNRQLKRYIAPGLVLTPLVHSGATADPSNDAVETRQHGTWGEVAVRLVPQMPVLLALSLALVRCRSSTKPVTGKL